MRIISILDVLGGHVTPYKGTEVHKSQISTHNAVTV